MHRTHRLIFRALSLLVSAASDLLAKCLQLWADCLVSYHHKPICQDVCNWKALETEIFYFSKKGGGKPLCTYIHKNTKSYEISVLSVSSKHFCLSQGKQTGELSVLTVMLNSSEGVYREMQNGESKCYCLNSTFKLINAAMVIL